MAGLGELEQRLGLVFCHPELLRQALVHGSWINESGKPECASNERLEFLGDAVLGLVAASWLYHRDPQASEGRLTRLRSALVRHETLAQVARDLDLGQHLLMSRGEQLAAGREREANLANALEAIIGAAFLDQGLETAEAMIQRILAPIVDGWGPEYEPTDDKSHLQELVQARQRRQPLYTILGAEGPDHDRIFTVQVQAGEEVLGQGQGRSKRAAEAEAARDALARLGSV